MTGLEGGRLASGQKASHLEGTRLPPKSLSGASGHLLRNSVREQVPQCAHCESVLNPCSSILPSAGSLATCIGVCQTPLERLITLRALNISIWFYTGKLDNFEKIGLERVLTCNPQPRPQSHGPYVYLTLLHKRYGPTPPWDVRSSTWWREVHRGHRN